jgi:hypothetical protein
MLSFNLCPCWCNLEASYRFLLFSCSVVKLPELPPGLLLIGFQLVMYELFIRLLFSNFSSYELFDLFVRLVLRNFCVDRMFYLRSWVLLLFVGGQLRLLLFRNVRVVDGILILRKLPKRLVLSVRVINVHAVFGGDVPT